MNFDNIPQELRVLPQWVNAWDGNKCPMRTDSLKAASSSDPDSWGDYEQAILNVKTRVYDYPGFVFNDNGIVGIDIDCGFDDDGFLSDIALDIMSHCESYTEISRSGRGMHIYLRGDLPFKGKNNGEGVEIYKSNRFFIVTGERLIYAHIIENQAAIDYVVEKYFPEMSRAAEGNITRSPRIYNPSYDGTVTNGRVSLKVTYPPIKQGTRNISLLSLGGQLHSQGMTKEQVLAELLRANREACKPPLPEAEVRAVVESVTKYERK